MRGLLTIFISAQCTTHCLTLTAEDQEKLQVFDVYGQRKAPWWNHLVKIHFVKSVIWWMCIFKWWNELAHREIWYHLVKKIFNSWNSHSIGENEYQLVIINSIPEHFSDSDDTSLAINLSIYSENDIFNQVAVFYPYRIDQTNLGKIRNIC